jgi:carboxypeptidase family protein/TonB-dependent receptor-like protein
MNLRGFGKAIVYRIAFCSLLLGVADVVMAHAQTPTGSVTGLIEDSTGSAIGNASVVATNLDTMVTYKATASAGGVYVLPTLPIGRYSIRVTAQGFESNDRTGVTVAVDQHAELDFTLQTGSVSQTITVVADATQIEADTHSIGTVVDAQKIVQLPLNSRTFTNLAFIVPAVYPPVFNSSLGYRGGFNVAGASEASNTSIYDGFDNNNDQQSIPSYQPSVDAIAEFKVLTGMYDAEYGRDYGGQLVVTGKSGTNAFHGTLYEYLRNQVFDADNFFIGNGTKPYYKRSQFGATLGGPIRRNHTFFFFGFEGLRDREQVTAVGTVPEPAWLKGDLSSILPAHQLKNPFIGGNIANNNLAAIPQWTAQAAIVGRALAAYYPTPTNSNTFSSDVPVSNYNFNGARSETSNQWSLRVDQTFSQKDSMYGEYNFYQDTSVEPSNSLCGSRVLPGFGCYSDRPLSVAGGSETHIFKPNLLNTVRLGFNRYEQWRLQQDHNINFVGTYGLTNVFDTNLANNMGVPAATVTSFSEVGGPNNIPQDFVNNTYNLADQLIYIKGNQTIKIGFDFRRIQQNSLSISNGRGVFAFSASSSAPTTGFAFADLLLGYPTSTTNNPLAPKIYVRTSDIAPYFQDDWKFNPKVTLNLGIRWELQTPFISANNQLSNFNTANGTVILAAVNGQPRNIIQYDYSKFQPRVGFSYSANSKTVVRGGYGLYTGLLPTFSPIGNLYYNPPMRDPGTFQSTTVVASALTLADPFPSNAPAGTATVTGITPNFLTPYLQQFGLGMQRQVTANTLLDVSYYGSKGAHLQTQNNINQPPPSTLATAALVNATRPFPAYGSIVQYQSSAASDYNALEVKVEKRLSNGLNGLISYTYSKSLDDALAVNPQNSRNVAAEYGNSVFDARQRLVVSGLYQLPFGHNGYWIKSGPASWVVGGWEYTGIASVQTGHYLTPVYSANVSNTYNSEDRPNLVGNPNAGPKTVTDWFNINAFSKPATGTFGNAGRDIIEAPGYTDLDSTLARSFPLPRESNLQFRAEFFNVFNHPNFDPPNVTADSASFGAVPSAEAPRQMQFALRVTF